MRIHIVSAAVLLSLCGVPLHAAAQSVCMKPWAIADKWIDNHDVTEPVDQIWTPDDTFETVDARGNPLLDADFYMPRITGFSTADIGRRVWLKVDDAGSATQGWFFAVDIGGAGAGAGAYRTAIATCPPTAPDFVHVGDALPLLKGNLHGPTIQGVADLISQDPGAYWAYANNKLAGSCADYETPCAPFSPRMAVIAAFNPAEFELSSRVPGALYVTVTNLLSVFVEGYYNGYVFGVLAPMPEQ